MSEATPQARQVALVDQAFRTLPDRYLGADPGFDATFQVKLGDIGHVYEVRATEKTARVRKGQTTRRPDVVIGTDSATWLRLRQGDLSGIEAFSQRRLYARGALDLAVSFEGRFRLPNGREPLLRMHEVDTGRVRISTMTMGEGPDMVLIHGLGATKASFYDTAATLSRSYRVHAIDLPGFGSSSKPARASYDAGFFADSVIGALDAMGIERAHLVGNSLGGRVSLEIAMRAPDRVRALGLLCPAVAFVKRGYHPIVRVLRPEFGLLPHRFGRDTIAKQFWSLFADRDLIDPAMADVVVDEFQRIYASRNARLAFLSAARNVYLDRPFGRNGFYERLGELQRPSLFIWGSHDRLIPSSFQRHVAEWLPAAEQIVLDDCGHAPQVERPGLTTGLLSRFFARADAVAPAGRRQAASAAA